ncbi:MAG: electron transfer flavoprotein subunit beta/FixA family protein [Bifidobacteriaceae bacterium]|jgi:electron transfer flavoprotein beta subunit|nr:electron transfer flavoprotein subunit beta/FixA family protein [Bifidobacteriaceae bacterium]
MKIIVLVKYVPDIEVGYRFKPDGRLDRSGEGLLNQLDEYPLEAARRLVSQVDAAADSTVTALTVGPDEAEEAIRRALQMGADRGVHICDQAIAGSDALGTSLVLAAAINQLGGADLILCGASSADSATSLIPVQLAARLQIPALTGAASLAVNGAQVTACRLTDNAMIESRTPLPALVSLTDQAEQPTYPSAKAVMLARRKPVEVYDLADLGLAPSSVGCDAARVKVLGVEPAIRRVGGRLVDASSDDAVAALVALLRDNALIPVGGGA